MMTVSQNFSQAITSWQSLLGEKHVLLAENSQNNYGKNTISVSRNIPAAIQVQNKEELAAVIQIAYKNKIPIYPISTGNNWGYGSSCPVVDECVVVDLSKMDRILHMDAVTGAITLEPGVTQKKLRDYLDEKQLNYMVPATGAGPDCSIIGNALERGYGITPHADHFAAVMSLEAILANGQTYRSALSHLGGEAVDQGFKWGFGPYLDGIFSQGNFGVVTQMTIALAPKPERVEAFFFSVPDDSLLEEAVTTTQNILKEFRGISGSINLMNMRRILSMIEEYPQNYVTSSSIIPEEVVALMAQKNQIMSWMGAGALYGNAKVVALARRLIRKRLKRFAKRIMFFDEQKVQRYQKIAKVIPGSLGKRAQHLLTSIEKSLQLLGGSPSDIALPLAYWKMEKKNAPFHPAKDGCGLFWYAPLVPMKTQAVRSYTEMVYQICSQYGMEPLITLTSLSEHCFDSTVPLIYQKDNHEEAERAEKCFLALLEEGKKQGFIPYRTNINTMDLFVCKDSPYWQVAHAIKNALDVDNIISPGRYNLNL